LIVVCTLPSSVFADEYREWKDITGKYQIKAKLVRLIGDDVVLEKSDGKEITVPLRKLSLESQAEIRKLLKIWNQKKVEDTKSSENQREATSAGSNLPGNSSGIAANQSGAASTDEQYIKALRSPIVDGEFPNRPEMIKTLQLFPEKLAGRAIMWKGLSDCKVVKTANQFYLRCYLREEWITESGAFPLLISPALAEKLVDVKSKNLDVAFEVVKLASGKFVGRVYFIQYLNLVPDSRYLFGLGSQKIELPPDFTWKIE
jgi:hypothetical protein